MSTPSSPEPGARREWKAYYFDGRTASRHDASVHLMPSGLEIAAAGSRAWWPYAQVQQTQGFYAGEEVRLERRGSAEALVIPDPQFLTALHRVAPDFGRRFHRPERRRRRVMLTVGAGVLAAVLTVAIYIWGIPAAATVIAARVPVSWEENVGSAITEQIAPVTQRCTEPRGRAALDALVGTVTRTPPEPASAASGPGHRVGPYRIRVIALDTPVLNAVAIPGGHVVLMQGLLDAARTPEQLAGVLAHEIQHIVRRHSTRAVLQHASSALLVAAVVGDVSGVMAYGIEGARTLALLRYSRDHEEEADLDGYRMLVTAGIDPRGLIEFFRTLEKEHAGSGALPAYLSTHPTPLDRVARLEALPRPSFAPAPLLTEEQWQAIKGICADRPK